MSTSGSHHIGRYTLVQPANQRHCVLLILCGMILIAGLALWPGRWSPRAYANNITLVSFRAIALSGLPEIYVEWETATEIDTVGFFLDRSDNAIGPFTRVSVFIPGKGDDLIGAQYNFMDGTTVLHQTYYYRLEAINTDQTIDYHGPISATAGLPPGSLIPRAYLPLIARAD